MHMKELCVREQQCWEGTLFLFCSPLNLFLQPSSPIAEVTFSEQRKAWPTRNLKSNVFTSC